MSWVPPPQGLVAAEPLQTVVLGEAEPGGYQGYEVKPVPRPVVQPVHVPGRGVEQHQHYQLQASQQQGWSQLESPPSPCSPQQPNNSRYWADGYEQLRGSSCPPGHHHPHHHHHQQPYQQLFIQPPSPQRPPQQQAWQSEQACNRPFVHQLPTIRQYPGPFVPPPGWSLDPATAPVVQRVEPLQGGDGRGSYVPPPTVVGGGGSYVPPPTVVAGQPLADPYSDNQRGSYVPPPFMPAPSAGSYVPPPYVPVSGVPGVSGYVPPQVPQAVAPSGGSYVPPPGGGGGVSAMQPMQGPYADPPTGQPLNKPYAPVYGHTHGATMYGQPLSQRHPPPPAALPHGHLYGDDGLWLEQSPPARPCNLASDPFGTAEARRGPPPRTMYQ